MTVIIAVASVLGILAFAATVFRWIGKIDANTTATDKLTVTFESFVNRVGHTLEDHGVRLTKLETISSMRHEQRRNSRSDDEC